MARRRVEQLEQEVQFLRGLMPEEAFQGVTTASPFEAEARPSRLPWRRGKAISEAAPDRPVPAVSGGARLGFVPDIPRGGATEFNQGATQIGGIADRKEFMEQLQELYVNCGPANSSIDVVTRFCTAGGMTIDPDDESPERQEKLVLTAQAQKAQALFDFTNPQQNFRQLMRMIFTDLQVHGDAFVEVVWVMDEPVALYHLPCPDMLVLADEHGTVLGYVQRTDTDRKAYFEPREVIHIKLESPRGGIYGMGALEKCVHSVVTWISTEALLKKTMQRGNPPRFAVAHDVNTPPNKRKTWLQKYVSRNLGAGNIGNPVEFDGKVEVHLLDQNKLTEYKAVKADSRDEIFGVVGTPPAIVAVIESGNLGGGTGTSQFKNFKVNTCGPLQELVLEAFTFAILQEGFKVSGKRCGFEDIDWRDDEVVEKIRNTRVDRGIWSIDRARDDVGEPPTEGGDDPVIVLARDVVRVKDIAAKSMAGPLGPGPGKSTGLQGDDEDDTPEPPTNGPGSARRAREAADDELLAAWEADVRSRRGAVVRELIEAGA